MRFLLPLPLLVLLACGYPYGVNKTIITMDDYPDHMVIYEGQNDIVDIMVPLNGLNENNNNEQSSEMSKDQRHHMLFFIEADIEDNRRIDHGIYMLYSHGKAIQIMDKGRAIAASYDNSKNVFIGAKDGLYIYNPDTKKAEKYSEFNDSIKDMVKEQYSDVIYILTDDGDLYKVYDNATKKVKVDDVNNAEQIMMDYSNNLYYYDKDKRLYVRNEDGETKKVEGLPDEINEIKLLRPLLFNNEEVGVMIDNKIYTIFSDGTSQSENVEFMPAAKPTAFSMEAGIFHYFGYQKKIYEYELSLMEDYEFTGYEFDSSQSDES